MLHNALAYSMKLFSPLNGKAFILFTCLKLCYNVNDIHTTIDKGKA